MTAKLHAHSSPQRQKPKEKLPHSLGLRLRENSTADQTQAITDSANERVVAIGYLASPAGSDSTSTRRATSSVQGTAPDHSMIPSEFSRTIGSSGGHDSA